tara:strand:+ start:249 stop:512 length:264 start_codon:yes stop_codon:yes gene_type:complete
MNTTGRKMKTLTYWIARSLDNSKYHSIRGKTRHEAVASMYKWCELEIDGDTFEQGRAKFGPVTKVTVPYRDAFDLLCWVSEDRIRFG